MRKSIFAACFLTLTVGTVSAEGMMKHSGMDHGMKGGGSSTDERISLNLPPMMKQHQLANMRAHLDAVRKIVSAIAEDDFEGASTIAGEQLGSNERMMKMCNSFENEAFKGMGLAFHKSGDDLAETLKKGNLKESLRALNSTMNYCVSCHATFRQ
ncbi:MAG: cytochrome C [Gammaproteobacteria bacterium]|nr:MAG: cytochrome C [Gammaproteobacteria bacterium]RLA23055.1 MAG: cytochrome C [Gammaproteobacteria bacterium]